MAIPTLHLDPAIVESLKVYFLGTPIQGPTGASAYEAAVAGGYVGTEAEWLEHLRAKNIELRIEDDRLQWRSENGTWLALYEMADLVGEQGTKGDKGDKGDTGPSTSFAIGDVVTVAADQYASVTMTGGEGSKTIHFNIPRGAKGDSIKGDKGDTGDRAWTPVLSLVADGDRRVFAVDWANGSGLKPVTGYLGSSGVTSVLAEALNVRGSTGAAGTGVGDLVAANNLSEVDPELARANLQVPHEGGTAYFTSVNFGTGGASVFSDNDGSVLLHAGAPAIGESYFSFDKNGNLYAYQGSFITEDGEVWHPGNLDPATFMLKTGGNFTGNAGVARGNAYTTFSISANAGQNKRVLFQSATVNRWGIGSNSGAESTGNAGSNFEIVRFADDGSTLGTALSISRASGRVTTSNGLTVANGISTDTFVSSGVTSAFGLAVDTPNSDYSVLEFRKASHGREFAIYTDPRSSATVGGNLYIQAHDNAGTAYNFMSFDRVNKSFNVWQTTYFAGNVNFTVRPVVNGNTVWDAGNFDPNSKLDKASPTATGVFTAPNILIDAPAATYRALKFTTNGSERWGILMDNSAETGTSAGGNLYLVKGTNAGTTSNVMFFERATGHITVYNNLTVSGSVITNTLNGGSTGITVNGSGEFYIGGSGGLRVNANKIRFGTTASTEGFSFASATMYLENNRNFSIGAGNFYSGNVKTGSVQVNGAATAYREIQFQTDNSVRWKLFTNPDAEGGDFYFQAYSNVGAYQLNALKVVRSNGDLNLTAGNLNLDVSGKRVHIEGTRQPKITVQSSAPTATGRQTGDLWIW